MSAELPEEARRSMQRIRMRTCANAKLSPADAKKREKTRSDINKKMGVGTLSPISLVADRHDVQCVSTGFQEIDDIISGSTVRVDGKRRFVQGSGRGLPRGRIIEIWGPESSGKTTWVLMLVKSIQERGGKVAFVDAENSLDLDYADRIGCDTETMDYSPGGGDAESTLTIVDKLVADGTYDLVVVDSVAALTPRAELDGEIGDHHVGVHARLMSQSLRKINGRLTRGHKTIVIFINQTRMKIGVRFGDPETTTGGNALKFYASVRIRVSSMGELKKGGEKGMRGKMKVRKTKVGVPFGEAFYEISGGNGVVATYSSDPRAKDKSSDDDEDD